MKQHDKQQAATAVRGKQCSAVRSKDGESKSSGNYVDESVVTATVNQKKESNNQPAEMMMAMTNSKQQQQGC